MKTAIAEDHVMWREVIEKLCAEDARCELVGSVGAVADALALLSSHRLSVLILDVSLPDGTGFRVAEAARQATPGIRCLMLTSYINDFVLQECHRLNVHGFVCKTANLHTLRMALAAIFSGKTFFSPEFLAAKAAWQADPRSIAKRLTDCEQRILPLLARGLNDEEIGQELNIAKKTAETHRGRILRRLGLPGTPKLIAFAFAKGFGHVIEMDALARKRDYENSKEVAERIPRGAQRQSSGDSL